MESKQVDETLLKIFRNVFFDLSDAPDDLVRSANKMSTSSWDSAQHLLLLTCMEEELGISIPDDMAVEMDSYQYAVAIVENLRV